MFAGYLYLITTLMHFMYLMIAGLSGTAGLEICSHVLSPIVFLKLKKSTGSLATDLDLLETIAELVSLNEVCKT
jgi:serine palmitoyltransferase